MKEMIRKNCKAFTLVEIMISIILIGVIAALAVPRVSISLEKVKMNEGKQILIELMKAQNNYRTENNAYTNDVADLNIEIPAPKNFKTPSVFASADPSDRIASIENVNEKYYMKMSGKGSISCHDIAASGYCALLGH